MGTNYYLHEEPNVCPTCGHDSGPEPLHIGKSSFGWCFALRVYPERGINTLDDWRPLFERWKIRDEYDRPIPPEVMLATITLREGRTGFDDRDGWIGYDGEADFHASNHSERGPKNLLRHQIDGRHCVAHGEGTWDYMLGEFS